MMNRHDAYYEPQDDSNEEFEQRVNDLLKNENNPYTAKNIAEMLYEDGLVKHYETLATLLQQGNKAAVGTILSSALFTYWENRSRDEVEGNL